MPACRLVQPLTGRGFAVFERCIAADIQAAVMETSLPECCSQATESCVVSQKVQMLIWHSSMPSQAEAEGHHSHTVTASRNTPLQEPATAGCTRFACL